ncbi:hypothetical protein GSH19_04895 [Lactobacillus sp. S2-2]|uniref:WxL domain-containing protein n=1 Tax=Lactobacillus sp. S2-2 TaxID=2692917 RepID=UPI001F1DFB79|nr:WxL domain-containing protein [Lactobacillus sp. S2-2]MCF6515488.1 hypothetical protein [Lactobacillus sp. S2-2]
MTFKNVNYIGSQLTASYKYTVNFDGNNNTSVNNYLSPFDKKYYSTLKDQVNIKATNINFNEGSTYNGSTENAGVFYLYYDGKLTLGDNSKVNLTSGGEEIGLNKGGEYGKAALTLQGNLETGRNSQLNIKTKPNGIQSAIDLSSGNKNTPNEFKMDKHSSVIIDDNGTDKGTLNNNIELAKNTKFLVSDNATFKLNTHLDSKRKRSIINANSGSTFDIDDNGNFEINASGSTNYDLLNFASNSKFIINNANRVDLNAQNNTNPSTDLIYMTSGSLESKIQHIYAWIRDNQSDKSSKEWTNIFNVNVPFKKSDINGSITADSTDHSISSDFKNTFKPHNYSRLLFTYIPDIDISIDNDLTSVHKDPNSQIIKGHARPGSFIRFSGDPAIPKGTLKGQSSSNSNLYHTQTSSDGTYSFSLPSGKYLTAKNKISAYGYLDGKSDTATKIVKQTPTGTLNNYLTDNKNTKKISYGMGDNATYNASFINKSDENLYNPTIKINIPKQFQVNKDNLKVTNDNNVIKNSKVIENEDGSYQINIGKNQSIQPNKTLAIKIGLKALSQSSNLKINSSINGFSDINSKYSINDINSNTITASIVKPNISLKSVPNTINFSNNKIAFSDKTYESDSNKFNPISVNDSRNDKNSGWYVTAQMNQFQDSKKNKLTGATLTIPKGSVTSNSNNTSGLSSSKVTLAPDSNNSAQTIFDYKGDSNNTTKETFNSNFENKKFKLKVPGKTIKDDTSYSTKINWSLILAP